VINTCSYCNNDSSYELLLINGDGLSTYFFCEKHVDSGGLDSCESIDCNNKNIEGDFKNEQ